MKLCFLLLTFVLFGFSAGRDDGVCEYNSIQLRQAHISDEVERLDFLIPDGGKTLLKNGWCYVYGFSNNVPCWVGTPFNAFPPPKDLEACIKLLRSTIKEDEDLVLQEHASPQPEVLYCIEYNYLDNLDTKRHHSMIVATRHRAYYFHILDEVSPEMYTVFFNTFAISSGT